MWLQFFMGVMMDWIQASSLRWLQTIGISMSNKSAPNRSVPSPRPLLRLTSSLKSLNIISTDSFDILPIPITTEKLSRAFSKYFASSRCWLTMTCKLNDLPSIKSDDIDCFVASADFLSNEVKKAAYSSNTRNWGIDLSAPDYRSFNILRKDSSPFETSIKR